MINCMLTFSINNHPIDNLNSLIAQTATLQPIHGRYRLGHTKLALFSAVLTPTAVSAIRTSKPSDALTVVTENGTRLQVVAWGWNLARHILLAHLAW